MQIWPFLRWRCISQTSFPGEVAKTIHKSSQISLMCWVDPMLSYGCLSRAKSLYIHIDHLFVCFSWLLISIKIEILMSVDNVYFTLTIFITIFLCNSSHKSLWTIYHSQEVVSWFNTDSGSSVVISHKIYLCKR